MQFHPRLPLILGVLAGGAAYMIAPIMDVDPAISLMASMVIPLIRLYWGGWLAAWIFAAPASRRGGVRLGLLIGGVLSLLLLIHGGPAHVTLRLAAAPLLYGGAIGSLPGWLHRRKLRQALFGALGGGLVGPLIDVIQNKSYQIRVKVKEKVVWRACRPSKPPRCCSSVDPLVYSLGDGRRGAG